jgi:hypothetical protein
MMKIRWLETIGRVHISRRIWIITTGIEPEMRAVSAVRIFGWCGHVLALSSKSRSPFQLPLCKYNSPNFAQSRVVASRRKIHVIARHIGLDKHQCIPILSINSAYQKSDIPVGF